MKKLRSKPTYADVMATIAVFIALGGASYAAIEAPKNSVGNWVNATTIPSHVPESVISSTSQAKASRCIQTPVTDTAWPMKNNR